MKYTPPIALWTLFVLLVSLDGCVDQIHTPSQIVSRWETRCLNRNELGKISSQIDENIITKMRNDFNKSPAFSDQTFDDLDISNVSKLRKNDRILIVEFADVGHSDRSIVYVIESGNIFSRFLISDWREGARCDAVITELRELR